MAAAGEQPGTTWPATAAVWSHLHRGGTPINGWMQYPTGAHFDIDTLRMEMTSFSELAMVSQVKFVHTVMAAT
ncbi:cytochrome ubiquinol oxidase subunit I [Escherichia coli]